jgi:hypothetical protein
VKIVFMLVMAAVIFFTNRRQAAAAAQKRPGGGASGDEDENARRAREEVRRRIAARRAEAGPRPVIAPDPAYRPKGPPPVFASPLADPEPSAFETEEERKVLAAQQRLEDQIQSLEKESAAVNQTARSLPISVLSLEPAAPPVVQLSELRDARDLSRAVIRREILDKPVGLR